MDILKSLRKPDPNISFPIDKMQFGVMIHGHYFWGENGLYLIRGSRSAVSNTISISGCLERQGNEHLTPPQEAVDTIAPKTKTLISYAGRALRQSFGQPALATDGSPDAKDECFINALNRFRLSVSVSPESVSDRLVCLEFALPSDNSSVTVQQCLAWLKAKGVSASCNTGVSRKTASDLFDVWCVEGNVDAIDFITIGLYSNEAYRDWDRLLVDVQKLYEIGLVNDPEILLTAILAANKKLEQPNNEISLEMQALDI